MMVLRRRGKPEASLHDSDERSQYSSEEFQRLLAEQNIACSMSRRGDCWDNVAIESFFSERASRRRHATRCEARADLFDYKERFYNSRRKNSTLCNISPPGFERRFGSHVEVSGETGEAHLA
jgi:putative transposase